MDEEKGVGLLSGPLWDIVGVSNVRDKSPKSPPFISKYCYLFQVLEMVSEIDQEADFCGICIFPIYS